MDGNASLGTQIALARYLLQMQQPRTQVKAVKGSTVVYRTPGVLGDQGRKDDLNVRDVFFLSLDSYGSHYRLTFIFKYLHSFSLFIFTYEFEPVNS